MFDDDAALIMFYWHARGCTSCSSFKIMQGSNISILHCTNYIIDKRPGKLSQQRSHDLICNDGFRWENVNVIFRSSPFLSQFTKYCVVLSFPSGV